MASSVKRAFDNAVGTPPAATAVRYRHGVRRPRWSGYTAFVLAGGGARGALQVGMLRALMERGERPDVIIGTSIGAWNGAWLASQPSMERLDELVRIWRALTPARVLLGYEPNYTTLHRTMPGILMLAAVRRVTQGHASLYPDTGARQIATRLMGDTTFADLAIPLRIVATNLTHGRREVFSSGPLAPVILASSAIPGIFPPVHIGDSVYVDGGALDNSSLDLALGLGARRVFVLNVGYDTSDEAAAHWAGEPPLGDGRVRTGPHPLAGVLERTTQVMTNYQLSRAVRDLPPGIEFHLIRPADPTSGGTLDFNKASEWIEQGYDAARAYLDAALPLPVAAPRTIPLAPAAAIEADAVAAP
ncbi:MAG TPA: patatin-like phospholipase family protein [Ktedonobacterales bacterium]|nr:patatin-like phospholipase family protein [Ktedonobacterales bacterium]